MRGSTFLYVTMFALVLGSAFLAIWVYHQGESRDLVLYTISAVGFCVALLALFIAARTYASIDSVNDISKMDGNVLDNSSYVTSLPELICRYKGVNEGALSIQIFESIEQKIRRESHTAALFADTLQYMIDLVVLFPAVYVDSDTEKRKYRARMDAILIDVERRRDALRSISKGNFIQIGESIKLFKAVVSYQNFVADGNFNIHADLLHVRGPVLRNPVTKTVYHNYLGLYHNKKAMHLIKRCLALEAMDILSIDQLKVVRQRCDEEIPPELREEVITYLRSAGHQFQRALEASREDFMWPGFIKYNQARTLFFMGLMGGAEEKWSEVMDEAIQSRARLNMLVDEVLTTDRGEGDSIEDTHLRNFFQYQEELARLVKLNILASAGSQQAAGASLIYKGVDLTNAKGRLPKPMDGALKFSKVAEYWEAIQVTLAGRRLD